MTVRVHGETNMRKRWMILAVSLGVAAMAQASARDLHVDNEHCGYSSAYDVQAKPDGIDFHRSGDGHPSDVFMHDGQLRVNGKAVAVSPADAARLRAYESDMRDLLPQMAGIANEAIGMAFDALTTVAATLGGSQHHRDALVDRLNHQRREALRALNAHINAQRWDQQGFGSAIEQPVTEAANDMAHSITRSVLWAVLTGHASDVEARADAIDQSIDKAMDQRSDQLEARAKAVCPRLESLDKLQQQFSFRLADGSALQLLKHTNTEHENQARQVAIR
jgi:hypothetical protein